MGPNPVYDRFSRHVAFTSREVKMVWYRDPKELVTYPSEYLWTKQSVKCRRSSHYLDAMTRINGTILWVSLNRDVGTKRKDSMGSQRMYGGWHRMVGLAAFTSASTLRYSESGVEHRRDT